jgi:hypothetical protein
MGSRSGAPGRPIRAALSVRCGKERGFRADPGQGIFYHPRRESFRAGREFIGRGREMGVSIPANQYVSVW